jgi:hypothetical protein
MRSFRGGHNTDIDPQPCKRHYRRVVRQQPRRANMAK